jgi:glutamate dehydrogenase (NAD(P)+)/glutamate dehydrogenase (NADP+)
MTDNDLPGKLSLEFFPGKNSLDRFSRSAAIDQEQRVRLYDPDSGKTWGFVVVDDTRRGPGLGGIRMAPDLRLQEVCRLARAMTLKNSSACLPFGGGKSGIVADPGFFNAHPELKAKLIEKFAEALFPLDKYITAPDMGTNEQDVEIIYQWNAKKLGNPNHGRGGTSRPEENGGVPIDNWGLTAHGLFAAARTLESCIEDFHIADATVVIQGYGNVGSMTASKLHSAGAIIIGASDIHRAIWNPTGLDVNELNSIRLQPGGLDNYKSPVEKSFGSNKLDWLLEAPCDILVPSARPDAITSRNADRIDCRIILQGANAPSNKMTEYYLENRRNILSLSDFIVNVGGVIGCAVELNMAQDVAYRDKVLQQGTRNYIEKLIFDTVSKNVCEILQRKFQDKANDRIFREEAMELAEERLRQVSPEYWI